MAKKKREKAELFETARYQNHDQAEKVVARAKKTQVRYLIGFALAALATLLAVMDWMKGEEPFACVFLGIAGYIIGGGFLKAIKTAWSITKFFWFIIPFFPADLICALVGFVLSVLLFLYTPVVFVGMSYFQHKKDLEEAELYLAGRSCASGLEE